MAIDDAIEGLVKLAAWRKREGKTQEWLAEQLGVSQPYVSAMERVRSPRVPPAAIIVRAYVISGGEVGESLSDWYDLPALAAERRDVA